MTGIKLSRAKWEGEIRYEEGSVQRSSTLQPSPAKSRLRKAAERFKNEQVVRESNRLKKVEHLLKILQILSR